MLSRLTLAFFAASIAIAVAACSSYGSSTVGGNGVGPNFPSQTLYAASSNQNSVDIYAKGQKSGTGPAYRIGGATTTLNGPQYIALDSHRNLWITNYNTTTGAAALVEIAALATGNVLPLGTFAFTPAGTRVRGIAITPKSTASPSPAAMWAQPAKSSPSASPSPTPKPVAGEIIVMAAVVPTDTYPNQLQLWQEGQPGPYNTIAGPNPNLLVPGGVALDKNDNIYVAEIQGSRVDKFVLPTPSPTPKPTPTPSPTPTPTATPSGAPSTSPSPSATPSPTPTPINVRPTFRITGQNTHVNVPTSVALDAAGNIYISDQGTAHAKCSSVNGAPAILIYARPKVKGVGNIISAPPAHIISGCATKLNAPTDVKVDSQGLIYVADTTQSGNGVVYIFAPGKYGNVQYMGYYTSSGNVSGLIVVP